MRLFAAGAFVLFAGLAVAEVTFDSTMQCGNGWKFTQTGQGIYSFEIEPDSNSNDRQWFYFAVSGAAGETLTFNLQGIAGTNVPSHWSTARSVFSTDGGATWAHITGATSSTSTVYTFTHAFTADREHVAFHFPYSYTDVQQKLEQWKAHPDVQWRVIGQSVQGRDIVLLTITGSGLVPDAQKKSFWLIARQHAAEVTGSFKAEGFLDFLLSDADEARILRHRSVIHFVPMVNPDGVVIGNYRDNALGANLNREWNTSHAGDSPEVAAIVDEAEAWIASGKPIHFFGDLHSTSGTNPHFAFHGSSTVKPPLYEDPENYYEDSRAFLALVNGHASHFNPTQGSSSGVDLRLAWDWFREKYGSLAFTFEGGYNRLNYGPNSSQYLTPAHHRAVGEAIARSLVEYYGLEPLPPAKSGWLVQ